MVRVWTLGRICEDLSLEVIAMDLGGGRSLWRHDAGSIISRKKTPRDLLYVQPTNLDLHDLRRVIRVDRRKCGQRARPSISFVDNSIDLPWQSFKSPQFGTKFQKPVPSFSRYLEFPGNAV